MENKIELYITNNVIIPVMVYDDIIKRLNEYKENYNELINRTDIYEGYFWNDIYNAHEYGLKKIESVDLDDYYTRNIISDVLRYGNININYILFKIAEMKRKVMDENGDNE